MFQVTPIGSCRIATPLRLARERYGFTLNRSRSLGFCHSSGEAVQTAHFLRGEFEPPAELWPYIARDADRNAVLQTTHDPSDIYIVEISSAKRIMIDDVHVQYNYLTNAFPTFFSSRSRSRRFWDFAKTGDQAEIDAYLSQCRTPAMDRALLRRVRLSMTDEATLRADMAKLADLLPDVLFMTHVNARMPDGERIGSRSSLIDLIHKVGEADNHKVFDPTLLMERHGQSGAIEDESRGLAHFTEDFSHALADTWFDQILFEKLDDRVRREGEDAIDQVLVPHIEAMIAVGNLNGIDARLSALSRALPDMPALHDLRCQLACAETRADEALGLLAATLRTSPEDAEVLSRHAQLAHSMDRFAEALESERRLAKLGKRSDGGSLADKGQAAMDRGAQRVALGFFQLAIQADAPDQHALLGTAGILLNDPSLVRSLSANDIDILLNHLPAGKAMELAIRKIAGTDLADLLDRATELDPVQLDTVCRYLSAKDRRQLAVEFIRIWREAQDRPALEAAPVWSLLEEWLSDALSDADFATRSGLLSDLLVAHPFYADARVALRGLRREAAAEAKALAGSGDLQGLERLEVALATLPQPLIDLPLARARILFTRERYAEAIAVGEPVAEARPENLSLWAMLMRGASEIGDTIRTERFARQVLFLCDEDTSSLAREASLKLADGTLVPLAEAV
ncbi:hypothetical protein AADZ90_015360 [Aestuariibius sp. 2305UL40-4]|uniref:hypothetical protein n=1 Tax=Aestuariibius violaceus TaxID=3234132 RepID=UPI00345EAA4A